MRHFIFVTDEGTTYQPSDTQPGEDVDNAQVLGWDSGVDEADAFNNLLKNSEWLLDTTFDKVVMYELKDLRIAGYGFIHDNT